MEEKNLKFFPVIGLKMTNMCRMKCKFCCEEKQKYPQFDFEQYKKLIKMLAESGTKRICFTGGEPLLCPFIEDALKMSHELHLNNVIFTSDGKKLQTLSVPREHIDSLRISLHALGDKHDEIVQRKGAFEDIERSLDRLNKIGYNISINTVLTPDVYPMVDEIVKWCIYHNIKRIYLSNLLQSGLGEEFIKENGRITDEDFATLIKRLNSDYAQYGVKIISHPYEKNAECILMYGNGDMYVDPYFDSETHQKYIGNVFKEGPKKIFEDFANSGEAWKDYLVRLSRSTIYNQVISKVS